MKKFLIAIGIVLAVVGIAFYVNASATNSPTEISETLYPPLNYGVICGSDQGPLVFPEVECPFSPEYSPFPSWLVSFREPLVSYPAILLDPDKTEQEKKDYICSVLTPISDRYECDTLQFFEPSDTNP